MDAGRKIIFETSKYYEYAVYDNGDVTKTWHGELERESPVNHYVDNGGVFVWVNKRKLYVKSLVARNFRKKEYRAGMVIEFIDDDPSNCAVDNLRFVKRDTSKDNRLYTKVSIDGVEYDSIAAAERALFVSHGYLTKYFKGQVAGKIIEGHDVRMVKND